MKIQYKFEYSYKFIGTKTLVMSLLIKIQWVCLIICIISTESHIIHVQHNSIGSITHILSLRFVKRLYRVYLTV